MSLWEAGWPTAPSSLYVVQACLHLSLFTHHFADDSRRLQIFSVGFVAGLKQQYRRDLLQGDVNPRMATAVGNDQVWFQSGNGFELGCARVPTDCHGFRCARTSGRMRFASLSSAIPIGLTSTAPAHRRTRVPAPQSVVAFFECKRAVFVLNRGGKGVADHQQQACKNKTDKCQHNHIPAKSPASRALTHQNFNDPCIYSVRGWPA